MSYTPLQMAIKYSRYLLTATNGKGHGVHSPFIYDFIVHVLNDKTNPPASIEKCRKQLLKDETALSITDHGAGSASLNSTIKKVKEIAATSLKPGKYANLLFRIVNYYKADTVLELGTSLGITTACMASYPNAMVYTLEGDLAVAGIAVGNFQTLGLGNISLVLGNFDETLPGLLTRIPSPDVVFIDGNHRYEPAMRYFRQIMAVSNSNTILVFDDIHWSGEMEEAWESIKNDPSVLQTIDLFFIGIVLFRKEFKVKQHYCIRF